MNDYPAVLYVEDDASSRKVMRLLLKGALELEHVTFFEDSHHFMERVVALDPQPDIVFLDIHLKPFSGFEMLQMLRENPLYDAVPIVAMTASVMNEEVQQLVDAGFNGCIAKPIDTDSFPETLQRILEGELIWQITH